MRYIPPEFISTFSERTGVSPDCKHKWSGGFKSNLYPARWWRCGQCDLTVTLSEMRDNTVRGIHKGLLKAKFKLRDTAPEKLISYICKE